MTERQTEPTATQDAARELGELAARAGARMSALDGATEALKKLHGDLSDMSSLLTTLPNLQEMAALLDEKDRELKNRTRRTNFAMITALALALVLLVVSLSIGVSVSRAVVLGQHQRNILLECTTPTPAATKTDPHPVVHDCYNDGRAQTAGAIKQLQKNAQIVAVAAVQCASEASSAQVQDCVDKKVAAAQ